MNRDTPHPPSSANRGVPSFSPVGLHDPFECPTLAPGDARRWPCPGCDRDRFPGHDPDENPALTMGYHIGMRRAGRMACPKCGVAVDS